MKIDHEQTEDVVCPYCGHKQRDHYEFVLGDEEGDCWCGDCGKKFRWSVYRTEKFTTTPICPHGDQTCGC